MWIEFTFLSFELLFKTCLFKVYYDSTEVALSFDTPAIISSFRGWEFQELLHLGLKSFSGLIPAAFKTLFTGSSGVPFTVALVTLADSFTSVAISTVD